MKARLLSMLLAGAMMFSALGTTVSAQEIQPMPEEVTAEEAVLEEVPEDEIVWEAVPEDEVVGVNLNGGDSWENAVAIGLDTEYYGTFRSNKDVVWYKITIDSNQAPGYYNMYAEKVSGTGGTCNFQFSDEYGKTLKSYNYGNRLSYTGKLTPGSTYYIKMQTASTGNYKVSVYYTADPEGDNTADAYDLKKDAMYRGTNGKLEDPDYFKITTDAAGYYRINLTNENIYRIGYKFLDQWEKELTGWNHIYKSKDGYLNMLLDANSTYYLWVSGDEEKSGTYTVSYTYLPDPEGNTMDTAYLLPEGELYRGTNAISGDIDYYKFVSGAAGHYGLELTNESVGDNVYLEMQSAYGERLGDTITAYKNGTKYMDLNLDANTTYYFYTKGKGNPGNYTIQCNYLVDKEGDNKNEAFSLNENQQYESSLCSFNDVDFYKIVPNFSGRYDIKLVNRNSSSSISLYLYSEYEEQLKYDNYVYSTDKEVVFQYSLEQGKTYYLRVKGGNSGDYMICYKKDFPFTDVAPLQEGHWQYEAVEYVYENSIMSGKKATLFDPKANLTRAEFAQVLYNMAGKPYVSYKSAFTDVPSGQWYTNAVIWAYKQGIVSGYSDGRFGIKDNITREQVAKMLYMYSEYKRENVSYRASLSGFPDNGNVSGWAKSYVEWAVAMKMISGKTVDGNLCLVPKGQATRAECAAMISRYLQK